MTRRDSGPPERGGAPTAGSADHHHLPTTTRHHPSGFSQRSPASRYAGAWREGFCYGFLDALRCAARRTDDPEVWSMLSRLASEYMLAGGDD
jgi:hypothetical protein